MFICKLLTSNYSYKEVELLHCVTEGGCHQAGPCETAAEDNDWSTAKFVHQDTADRACRERRDGQEEEEVISQVKQICTGHY